MTLLLGTLFAALVIGGTMLYRASHKEETAKIREFVPMDQRNFLIPEGYFFDAAHMWVSKGNEGSLRIGLDDFLQHVIGKVDKIELLKSSGPVEKGDAIARIYQNGRYLQVYAPVSGIILNGNELLLNDSAAMSRDPYHDGWIMEIQAMNWQSDRAALISAEKAKSWIKDEWVRLKDFFSFSAQKYELAPVMVAMQDGGEIQDRALQNSSDDIWQEFQIEFIDSAKN